VCREELYQRDYPYFSSSSQALLDHAQASAENLRSTYRLNADSFVVEVGSNDGYLLRNFLKWGIPALGVDPADGPTRAAIERGVLAIPAFFSSDLARRLAAIRKADVIIASNVVAHVDEINDFVQGFKDLLKPNGVTQFEFAYAVDTIQRGEFDQIYFEHIFYHTLHGLRRLFERHQLFVNDAVHLDIHGGSLRVFVQHDRAETDRLRQMLDYEKALGVDNFGFYEGFADTVKSMVSELRQLLLKSKQRGRIACYGAASKGCTLLNCLDLGEGFFDFVVDQNPHKHGKYLPGQKLPIYPTEHLSEQMPPYCLLLVWNFRDEVLKDQQAYRYRGGTFIIPGLPAEVIPPGAMAA
jgi:SAM-dependent methyltransferase